MAFGSKKKQDKESGVERLAKKARGKSTCNSCMQTRTTWPKTIDGVTYMVCSDCKGSFE